MAIRDEVKTAIRDIEAAALAMRAAIHRGDRVWNRGLSPEEITAMRSAERIAQDSVLRINEIGNQ